MRAAGFNCTEAQANESLQAFVKVAPGLIAAPSPSRTSGERVMLVRYLRRKLSYRAEQRARLDPVIF